MTNIPSLPLDLWNIIYHFVDDAKTLACHTRVSKPIQELINKMNSHWESLTKTDYKQRSYPLRNRLNLNWKNLYCLRAQTEHQIRLAVKKIQSQDLKTSELYSHCKMLLLEIVQTENLNAANDLSLKPEINQECYSIIFDSLTQLLKSFSNQVEEKEDYPEEKELYFYLGSCYDFAVGVTKNSSQAFENYKRAAELGNAIAQYSVACCYASGKGVAQNDAEAFKYSKLAADNGYIHAAFHVSEYLLLGKGTSKNPELSFKYLSEASQEDQRAQYALGKHYRSVDPQLAFKHFQSAAERGHLDAQYEVGMCYKMGHGTAIDLTQSYRYFEHPANADHPEARFEISQILAKGNQKANLDLAITYCKKAASLGSNKAKFALIKNYFTKDYVSEEEITPFVASCEQIIEKEKPEAAEAAYTLGVYFQKKGETIKSFQYFVEAAQKKHLKALFSLGYLSQLFNKPEHAFKYYKSAADRGLIKAQTQVSRCYEMGIGVEKNHIEALRYKQLAAPPESTDQIEKELKKQKL